MSRFSSYVGQDSGKANATLRWIAENPSLITTPGKLRAAVSVYVTSRHEIETLDFSRFLASFGPYLPKKKLLRIRGRILFAVDGYDDTALDLFEIEEVRRFYRLLHMIWPCWLFAGAPFGTNLRALALCILPNLLICRTSEECRIRFSQEDLFAFFESCLPAAALLHDRSGIGKLEGLNMLKKVAAHLGVAGN